MAIAECISQFRDLVALAREQGWEVTKTKGCHWKFTPPDKSVSPQFAGSTPDSPRRFIARLTTELRRKGLVVPGYNEKRGLIGARFLLARTRGYANLPSMTHPSQLNALTIVILKTLVPGVRIEGYTARLSPSSGGREGVIRVKRASAPANQVHVSRGEPILVHIPDELEDAEHPARTPGEWILLDVDWQLRFARHNPKTRQHASSALDCMVIPQKVLATLPRVPTTNLKSACEKAVADAQKPEVAIVTRILRNVLRATAGAVTVQVKAHD